VMVFMAMDEHRHAERAPAWLRTRRKPGTKLTNASNNTVPAEELATIRARAKGNLEALCKQLTLPVPLLLALAAGLMAGEASITISGAKLPLVLAQLAVMLSVALAMLQCARLSFALSRDLHAAPSDETLRALLRDNPTTLNPFYALPPGGGVFGSFETALAVLPVSGVGLIIGLAAAFLFPFTSVPGVTEEVLVGLILGMSLLHAIAFAAASLGVFSMLTWPRRLLFSVTLVGGVILGAYAAGVVQDVRAQAPHQPPPPITAPGQRP
jgi:hypothetical protein